MDGTSVKPRNRRVQESPLAGAAGALGGMTLPCGLGRCQPAGRYGRMEGRKFLHKLTVELPFSSRCGFAPVRVVRQGARKDPAWVGAARAGCRCSAQAAASIRGLPLAMLRHILRRAQACDGWHARCRHWPGREWCSWWPKVAATQSPTTWCDLRRRGQMPKPAQNRYCGCGQDVRGRRGACGDGCPGHAA